MRCQVSPHSSCKGGIAGEASAGCPQGLCQGRGGSCSAGQGALAEGGGQGQGLQHSAGQASALVDGKAVHHELQGEQGWQAQGRSRGARGLGGQQGRGGRGSAILAWLGGLKGEVLGAPPEGGAVGEDKGVHIGQDAVIEAQGVVQAGQVPGEDNGCIHWGLACAAIVTGLHIGGERSLRVKQHSNVAVARQGEAAQQGPASCSLWAAAQGIQQGATAQGAQVGARVQLPRAGVEASSCCLPRGAQGGHCQDGATGRGLEAQGQAEEGGNEGCIGRVRLIGHCSHSVSVEQALQKQHAYDKGQGQGHFQHRAKQVTLL